jgi:hypothetical protein
MKKLLSLITLFLILINGCTEDGPTVPEERQGDALASETVGPRGGTLETENFKLTIPAGAFSETTELKLFLQQEEKPFNEGAVSNFFRIEGLPANFQTSLQVAIKYQGLLSNSSFIAIGEDVFVKSLGEVTTTYCLFEATDSSGFLVVDLSIPQEFNATPGSSNKILDVTKWIKAVGITNLHFKPSNPEGFLVGRLMDNTTQSQLQMIGDYCVIADVVFKDKGFSYSDRNNWPILVILKEIKKKITNKSISAYYAASKFLKGHGYIVVNIESLLDPGLKETIGHELLHLIQDLYDSRNWDSKIKEPGGNHLWLDEATATYSQEFFC